MPGDRSPPLGCSTGQRKRVTERRSGGRAQHGLVCGGCGAASVGGGGCELFIVSALVCYAVRGRMCEGRG